MHATVEQIPNPIIELKSKCIDQHVSTDNKSNKIAVIYMNYTCRSPQIVSVWASWFSTKNGHNKKKSILHKIAALVEDEHHQIITHTNLVI